jgi:glycosyltransferase involved in cell wall biosynthesis
VRVGLVIYGSLETISGGFLYDRMLVDYLRSQGDEVEIISLSWRTYPRHLLDNFFSEVLGRLTTSPVDILLQDELCHPSLFWLTRRYRRACHKTPVIAIVHHLRSSEARPAWQNRFYRIIEHYYLAGVDGFIVNSRDTGRTVEQVARAQKPTVVAVPAGDRFAVHLTAEEIKVRVKAAGPLEILFLGNLIPRKGLHLLLSALAGLPRNDWRLTVAGSLTMEPAYTQEIHRRVEELGLAAQVAFTGPLMDEEVAAVLARSQVLAVPSTYEGYGIVYLEGMSFGLPAIATTAGGAKEIITHGRDGFLVAPDDVPALTECMRVWLNDRDKLLAMSLAARETFLAHPTWEESCAKIHAFLKGWVAKT